MSTLGEKIRKRRKELKLNGTELGRAAGMSQVMISRYERGETKPSLKALEAIAAALDVPPSYLLDNTEERATQSHTTQATQSQTQAQPEWVQPGRVHSQIVQPGRANSVIEESNAHFPEMPDSVILIPFISREMAASAGPGNDYTYADCDTQPSLYPLYAPELTRAYSERTLRAMLVDGDSMEPMIGDHDVIVFKDDREPHHGYPHVVRLNGALYVKIILMNKRRVTALHSLNPLYRDIPVSEDDELYILGQVLACQTYKRFGMMI